MPVMATLAVGVDSKSVRPNQGSPNDAISAHVRTLLENQGLTDIHVVPSSFIIHALDKDGNPVVLSVTPDSISEVTVIGASGPGRSAEFDATHTGTGTTTANNSGAHFVSIPSNDELSSNIIGLDVYNNSNQDVGQIKDIALNSRGRTDAYILSVGGFLGIGTHYVAVNPADVKISYNDSDKKRQASMNATSDQLKSAPEFKYTSRFNAGKS